MSKLDLIRCPTEKLLQWGSERPPLTSWIGHHQREILDPPLGPFIELFSFNYTEC